jgi:uncharacterized protein (TIGR01777 family)
MQTILISGASGLVGRSLGPILEESGFEVRVLTRNSSSVDGSSSFYWDVEKGILDDNSLKGVDHIIHLAGENIGRGRWSHRRKKKIIESRVRSAGLLLRKCQELNIHLQSFISASATGYYGTISSERIFTEDDKSGSDFTAGVCLEWEKSAGLFENIADRVVILRTGIVLSADGGMMKSVLPTINIRFSPLFGRGEQYIPWIHIKDLCNIYRTTVINKEISGVFNAVSPFPIKYREFIRTIARGHGKKVLAPATPAFFWKILFGEKSVILLNGSRVSAEKILSKDFQFEFPKLPEALTDLIKQ